MTTAIHKTFQFTSSGKNYLVYSNQLLIIELRICGEVTIIKPESKLPGSYCLAASFHNHIVNSDQTLIIDLDTEKEVSLEDFLELYPDTKRRKLMAVMTSKVIPLDQIAIALEQDYEMIPIGELNAFSITPSDIEEIGEFDAVCVEHAAMALNLIKRYEVCVFEQENIAPEGEPLTLKAKELHTFNY
ncbi:hypothetical protein [Vibrio sp. 10N.239.312.D08]|uniref:hypothetical protein n=1 Tax=Vibrio sp. 10N.239.312.D08 TaxID=3229978 RepID=UPI00354AFFF4